MPSRTRWTFVLFTVIALIVAGAVTYNFTQPDRPPLPSEQVERRRARPPAGPAAPEAAAASGLADPAGLAPSVQNELNCVDRLLERGAPEGADLKAEWDRCKALGEAGENRMSGGDPGLEREAERASQGAGNGVRARP